MQSDIIVQALFCLSCISSFCMWLAATCIFLFDEELSDIYWPICKNTWW